MSGAPDARGEDPGAAAPPAVVPPVEHVKGLAVIAAFKLTGALLLSIVGLGALHLLRNDAVEIVGGWVDALGADVKGERVQELLARVAGIPPKRFQQVGLGAFAYASILVTQGVGLLRRKRWAEWLTVALTASFLPIEIYELLLGVKLVKVALLVVNAVIVWYLARHLRETSKRRAADGPR